MLAISVNNHVLPIKQEENQAADVADRIVTRFAKLLGVRM